MESRFDRRPLCRSCKSLKDLDLPTSGVIVSEPDHFPKDSWFRGKFGLSVGSAVSFKRWYGDSCSVLPLNPEYWISAKFIGPDGSVLGDDVWVRYVPIAKGADADLRRIKSLAWGVGGKRTIADQSDVEILAKFMKGDKYFRDGSDGPSVSMKSRLPRLRQLLGEPKK